MNTNTNFGKACSDLRNLAAWLSQRHRGLEILLLEVMLGVLHVLIIVFLARRFYRNMLNPRTTNRYTCILHGLCYALVYMAAAFIPSAIFLDWVKYLRWNPVLLGMQECAKLPHMCIKECARLSKARDPYTAPGLRLSYSSLAVISLGLLLLAFLGTRLQIARVFRYNRLTATESEDICLICHIELEEEDSVQLLCGHKFHKSCVDSWLLEFESTACPTCRYQIPSNRL